MVPDVITVVLVTVAVATPIIVLGKSIWDFWSGAGRRSHILLKGLMALGLWVCVSYGMMFMMFATFFGAAHTEYRRSHGGKANPSGTDDPTTSIVVLVAVYTMIGSGLVYVMLRRAKQPS